MSISATRCLIAARSPHAVDLQRLGDGLTDRQAGVERGERVLEDDLDVAAHAAAGPRCPSSVSSVPSNLTEPEVGRISCSTERPVVDFPHPDSPTRPEGLARGDGEGDAGDGVDRADPAAHERPAAQRELLDQVGDLEQRSRRRRDAGAVASRVSETVMRSRCPRRRRRRPARGRPGRPPRRSGRRHGARRAPR